jgi:hypothetical protein
VDDQNQKSYVFDRPGQIRLDGCTCPVLFAKEHYYHCPYGPCAAIEAGEEHGDGCCRRWNARRTRLLRAARKDLRARRAELVAERDRVQGRLDEAAELKTAGDIGQAEFRRMRAAIQRRVETVESELEPVERALACLPEK